MGETIQIVNWKKKKINDGFHQRNLWKTWEMNFLNLRGPEILCLYVIYPVLFLNTQKNEHMLGKEQLKHIIKQSTK